MPSPSIVLCCSGHDPSGGAGVQADIESCAANGSHAVSLITALTVQDTRNVQRVVATDTELLRQAAEVLLADVRPSAIKLGLIGSADQLPWLRALILQLRMPAVLDPILRAGGGSDLPGSSFALALSTQLFKLVEVLTPNVAEARLLTGVQNLAEAGQLLLATGARHVLITGGDEPGEAVVNWHFSQSEPPVRYQWPRLPKSFHGAGCTLAAAIAAHLAQGQPAAEAIALGQRYTQAALARSVAVGRGRELPGRWAA